MKLIKAIQNKVYNLPLFMDNLKLNYSENKAIKDKKSLFQNIIWTDEERKNFDDYWLTNYGKIISPNWHKLYQSINGKYRVDYFPEKLFSTQLEPLWNNNHYCRIYSDKSLLSSLFCGVEGVRVPKTYFTCCCGRICDENNNAVSLDELIDQMKNIKDFVIKPTIETGSGKNVYVINNNIDGNQLKKIIISIGKNYIIQEKIINSKQINLLHPYSLNTIRVISYYIENEIHLVPLVLRIGVNKNSKDNIHDGGISVGINDDGTLKGKAYLLGYGDNNQSFLCHPTTKIKFEGYSIGNIDRVKQAAINLHRKVPYLGIISWDLTINDNNEIILIEVNCSSQSVWFPQIVNECSLFGDNTKYVLRQLREEGK